MTKIKVGQIWSDEDGDDMIVITKIHTKEEFYHDCYYKDDFYYGYIFNCGSNVAAESELHTILGRKLIAEYDTWQEAVNSKEFKGGNYES